MEHKACPFCGSTDVDYREFDHNEYGEEVIFCNNCEAKGPRCYGEAEAWAEWDKRAEPEAQEG